MVINFKEKLENIKSLNPREMYSWPMPAKFFVGLILLFLSIAGGYFGIILNVQNNLAIAQQKETNLRNEYLDKKKKAINLDLYKLQLDEIRKTSDELLRQLPDRSQIEKLLIDINQAGMGRGLQFDYFKPGEEKILDFYAELPIRIKVTGTYDAVGNFVADLGKLSRVVLLKDMTFTYVKDDILTLDATAKTFRYLDPDEVVKQKQKVEDKSKKGKKKAK